MIFRTFHWCTVNPPRGPYVHAAKGRVSAWAGVHRAGTPRRYISLHMRVNPGIPLEVRGRGSARLPYAAHRESEREARLLGVPLHAVAVTIRRTYLAGTRPVETADLTVAADRYEVCYTSSR